MLETEASLQVVQTCGDRDADMPALRADPQRCRRKHWNPGLREWEQARECIKFSDSLFLLNNH